jgi:hypothetical protein
VVPRVLGLARDTVRPPQPIVSFGEAEPLPSFVQDRETLPPPVPMEQLVQQMMRPEIDPEALGQVSSTAETVPPPSDGDTIPPRSDADTVPPRGDDVATLPPPASDADTVPPTGDDEPEAHAAHEAVATAARAQDADTARALDTAEAVFQELGVELFKRSEKTPAEEPPRSRSAEEPPRSRSAEEPPRSRPVEEPPRSRSAEEPSKRPSEPRFKAVEPPRPRPVEEPSKRPSEPRFKAVEPPRPRPLVEEPPRSRPVEEPPRSRSGEEPPRSRSVEEPPRSRLPGSRVTPPRAMRALADPPPPPSSTANRTGQLRRKPSEPGLRPDPGPPPERPSSSGSSIPTSERLNELRQRYEAGDYQRALELAEAILADNPDHIAAFGYAESCRQMLRQAYYSRLGDSSLIPRVMVAIERMSFDARTARLLLLIDGSRSIDEILAATGLPQLEGLRLLSELHEDGIIELDQIPRGRR